MTDSEICAWMLLAGLFGGVVGHWVGTQHTIRLCRRIAKSTVLDDVFREDAVKDSNADDAIAAARRRFHTITRGDRG